MIKRSSLRQSFGMLMLLPLPALATSTMAGDNSNDLTIVPTTSDQIIVIKGNANLVPNSIKNKSTVFGVPGNPNVVDTSTGDATAADVRKGKQAWVDGKLLIGTATLAPPQPPNRFTDNGNGTITDNLTGLIWTTDGNCPRQKKNWKQTVEYVNNLAADTCDLQDDSKKGDWRLPNIKELQSLIDFSRSKPALPQKHPFKYLLLDYYWSATPNNSAPNKIWVVDINNGSIYARPKNHRYMVWPVRGGSAKRFIDNGNGTITDNRSGLIWTKNANCPRQKKNWEMAVAYVNNLAAKTCDLMDGSKQGDWRLPKIAELNGLIDFSQSKPALPKNHPFEDIRSDYWSATTSTSPTTQAWTVNFKEGGVYTNIKSRPLWVWPVRGGL